MHVAVKSNETFGPHGVGWSLKSHLSTLKVPPHCSFVTDGQASVVQHAQEKQRQTENQTSRDT